ncbi:MAG: UvrD-helicase domain-containing protein [Lentimonas sp.]
MNSLKHIAISASAGSGKTYQLTNRFIYLLHLAEQPERIVALTFTRTAAGEFFQKIIEKLCHAAEDVTHATALSNELGIQADTERYRQLLDLLIRSMHKLNLQTLDSFFFRVVSAFSLELGLSGNINLLDQSSEQRMRNEVRDSIVHSPGELTTELNEFWHAFKQATYGQEKRSVEGVVSEFIEQLYALYLDAPQAELWGQTDTIWTTGCPWKTPKNADWDLLGSNLLSALPEDLSASQRKDFETLAVKLQCYPAEEKTNTLLDRALTQADEILAGQSVIQCGRGKNNQASLSGSACSALADCLRAIVWHHLKRALENTQGVHRILEAYHINYDRLVRRPGKLAFADLTHLLSPNNEGSPMGQVDDATRQLMDFRLDGQFDHWLFDEFQDTSRPQWDVVANLIDEIVQDDSGQRSFFYVGDTKQCLYLWRNSDDRLFHDIQLQYPNIQQQPLSVSWRSAQPVLDAVNEVFSDQAAIIEHFSDDASARWARAWQTHAASSATKDHSGFACWIEATKEEDFTRSKQILNLLKDLDPINKGISVGVLARKNSDATQIAEYLRENSNLPVHTGSAIKPAIDNAAGVALLALIRLAAHPSDQHALGYLRLIDVSTQGTSLAKTAIELRAQLLSTSNESAVRWAAERIVSHLPDNDHRHRERLDSLVAKARDFDKEERRDIDGLHDFLQISQSGDCPASDAIIVETIHKSKGLEYDVVILVNEDKTVRSERRISPLLNTQGNAEWIMEPIKKELIRADPALEKFLEQSESQRGFGNLCTLYVAMTRAKRALYMISDPKGAHQGSTVRYLRDILGDTASPTELFKDRTYPLLWSTGDPDWHKSFETRLKKVESTKCEVGSIRFDPAHPRLQLSRPSAGKEFKQDAGKTFELDEEATTFGSEVHDAFEQVEWLNTDTLNLLKENSTEANDTLRTCFKNPEITSLFTKAETPTTVWNERAFSYVEDDQFYNGIFDRVVLHHDATDTTIRAEIIDYKTDRIHTGNTVEQASERHRPQLEAYRKALSKIIRLDEASIALKLLFTDVPKIIEL